MSLANIKLKGQERGFTIVELLIVVVVIAILAAITIVSYNGITNNAKKSSAQAAASTVAKKAELYQADQSRYPVSFTELSADTAKSWYMTAGNASYTGATITSAPSNPDAVNVAKCGSGSPANQAAINDTNITGIKVTWWDYTASQAKTVLVGDTTTCPTS